MVFGIRSVYVSSQYRIPSTKYRKSNAEELVLGNWY